MWYNLLKEGSRVADVSMVEDVRNFAHAKGLVHRLQVSIPSRVQEKFEPFQPPRRRRMKGQGWPRESRNCSR